MANEKDIQWEAYEGGEVPFVNVRTPQEVPDFSDYGNGDEGIVVEGYEAENKPVLGESSPSNWPMGFKPKLKEAWRRAKSMAAYGRDNAKQAINYGVDALAAKLGGVGGYSGYESTENINERVPANTQGWWEYDTKRRDYQDDQDYPYSSYVYGAAENPADEYADFTDTDVYRALDPDEVEVGAVGRGVGNVLNRLGGNFEPTDKQNEMAYRKLLAAGAGTIGHLGDTLPNEQAEMLGTEYGIRGGGAMLGSLSPAFIKMKNKYMASKKAKDLPVKDSLYSDYAGLADEKRMAMSLENARRNGNVPYPSPRRASTDRYYARRLKELKKQLTPEQYQALLQSGGQDLDYQTTILWPEKSKALAAARAERNEKILSVRPNRHNWKNLPSGAAREKMQEQVFAKYGELDPQIEQLRTREILSRGKQPYRTNIEGHTALGGEGMSSLYGEFEPLNPNLKPVDSPSGSFMGYSGEQIRQKALDKLAKEGGEVVDDAKIPWYGAGEPVGWDEISSFGSGFSDAEIESTALKNLAKYDISPSAANAYKNLDAAEKSDVLTIVKDAIDNGYVEDELDLAQRFADAVSKLYSL